MNKYLPYFAGFFTSFIFGVSFAFTSGALQVLEPLQLPGARFFFAAVFITILYFLKVFKLEYKGKNMKRLFFLALSQPVLYFIFETYGIKLTSSSQSGIMISLIPIVVVIFAGIFLKEKTNIKQWGFILLSVGGAIMMVMGSYSLNEGSGSMLGFVFLFGAVITASCYNILSRSLSKEFTPIEITFFMMWFAAISFGIISVVSSGGFSGYITAFTSLNTLLTMAYLGIVSSVVAFFLQNYMLSHVPAASAAGFANMVTVISVIAGVFVKGESITAVQLIGAAIILIGVFGVNMSTKESGEALGDSGAIIRTEEE